MEPCGRLVCRLLWVGALSLSFLVAKGYSLDPSRRISQYGHRIWRRQDGLVGATSPITQTTDGYIWIGFPSANGWALARFDGVSFIPWTLPRDTPFTLRHLSALLGASDGSLWIGTATGLGRLKDGHFRSYSKPGDRWGISSIIEDHAGHIWVTRYRVRGEGAICEALDQGLHCYGPADGVPLRYGLGLAEDTQGNFWIGSEHLCRWKPGSTCAIYFDKGPPNATVGTVTAASGTSQTVWAVANAFGREGGLQRFSSGKWHPYSVPGFNGSAVESEATLVDHNGSLWVGTEANGLYRIQDGMVDHYGPADGLTGHQVEQIYEDHEGNLWVTTDGGMDMFRNTPVFSYSVREGLSSAYPKAVLASRDGSIWITTTDGLDVLRDGRKQALPVWLSREQAAAISVFEDHTGTIWFSYGHNLAYWDHGHFHRLVLHKGDSHQRVVTGVTEDAQHHLWALSQTDLFRIDQRQVQQYVPLPKNFVPSGFLAPDLQDGIWISDNAGHIFHYSNGQFQTMELKNTDGTNASIQAMIVDADDPLLVATLAGLFRWDGQRWTVLDARNGLPCAQFASIVKDAHGALWLGAEQCGFLRIEPSDLAKWRQDAQAKVAVRVVDRLDGAYPGVKLTGEPHASRAPDGRLWFANGVDVETLDPEHLYRNPALPPVHVQTVIADDISYDPSSAARLPAGVRNLEIDYTALSLSVPQKVKFRYKLEGHDPDWENAGTRRQAFYTDLKPGSYTFRVIACNNDGLWNESGAAWSFAVAPAFDQTAWFKALCILAAAGAVWALYWLRLRQATIRLRQRLGAQMEERERIAHELHDTLLQGVQGLMFRLQAVNDLLPDGKAKHQLEQALQRADQAIGEGRNAVFDLRSSAQMNALPQAVRALGAELATEGSAAFKVVVEGSERTLQPIVRDEIYRITHEALRNAFNHARANQVETEITYGERIFRLRIRDDGQGIPTKILEEGRPGHYGLAGMRERAGQIGGKLEVWSQVRAGTEIELSVEGSAAYDTSTDRSLFRLLRRKAG